MDPMKWYLRILCFVVFPVVLAGAVGSLSCDSLESNNGADTGTTPDARGRVDAGPRRPQGPIEVDILWVMDNSASMWQETVALSRAFDEFAVKLKDGGNFDIRTAVVSMKAMSGGGVFVNSPAQNFPPACIESIAHACLTDADCVKKFGNDWECKSVAADNLYNMNGSVNSTCTFRCSDDADCCKEFCFADECGPDQSCLLSMCQDAPDESCSFQCKQYGLGEANSGCLQPPDTADCPSSVPPVLTNDNLELFKCLIAVAPDQSYQANIEQGLKAAWTALNPDGPNAEQAIGFLRPAALLLVIFVSDEDDCSIHEDFASPSHTCETDDDCGGGPCKTDVYFSQLMGQQIKLCGGVIKKDYYNICSFVGEYKGQEHHHCAYDLDCENCSDDTECDYGWYCKQGKKCRPYIYSLVNIASYQSPPGTPINSLSPVSDFHNNLKSLKSDPSRVLVAAINGDGVVHATDKESLISDECLGNEKLSRCAEYAAAKVEVPECVANQEQEGCETFVYVRLDCIRECYVASKGDSSNPSVAKNSYICNSDTGKADFGSRYVRLAEMFGLNGVAANICAPEAMPAALNRIADMLLNKAAQ